MQTLETKKKEIVTFFLKKGLLLSNDVLEQLENDDFFSRVEELLTQPNGNITVLNSKIKELLEQQKKDINWQELDNLKTRSEKKNGINYDQALKPMLETPKEEKKLGSEPVKVLYSYSPQIKKREAQDFTDCLNHRFKTISSILKQRQEMQNTISINRILSKKDREQIAVIGMVLDKKYTKNNNCLLTIEDQTGTINVIINKNKPELFDLTKDIIMDEVVGITGTNADKIIFANNLVFPDVPITEEMKKASDDTHVVFLSDLHVGSHNFLKEDFEKFLRWINQDLGDEKQKELASKVKYIFVLGDLVDGIGIYPDQEKDLSIKDVKEQYVECAKLLAQIPKHIPLIICPGNHDAMRVAEPQLPIYRDFAQPLYDLPNAIMVSNPALINIHSSPTFPGFNVLVYHGYSFDYYVAEVETIRNNGGYDRADLIMKFLLQKRHLAPAHTSTLYAPDTTHDPLVIEKVPDFLCSGHIHKTAVANYRNITLICGSCWQSKTSFQEKVGHHPEPSRVPIVNLQTRNIKILRFGSE